METTPTPAADPIGDPIAAANAALAARPWDPALKEARLDAFKAKFGTAEVTSTTPARIEYDAAGEELAPLEADADIGTLNEGQLRARLDAINGMLGKGKYNEGSLERRSLALDREAIYRRLYPESDRESSTADAAKPAEAAPTLTMPALPPKISDRQYDAGVVRELDTLVSALPADDSLRDALPMFVSRGNANLARGVRPDPDEVDAELDALWGAEVDARLAAARSELQRSLSGLTAAAREKVLAYLDETGLSDDVALIRFFAVRSLRRTA